MAATASLLPPLLRVTDQLNAPVSGAIIECFDGGTTTPKSLYSDADLSVSLGTSVVCDSAGYPTSNGMTKTLLYTSALTSTKLIFKSSGGTTLVTHDNIPGGVDINNVAALVEFAKPQTPTVSITSAVTLGSDHYGRMILADPTGGSFSLQLPSAAAAGNGANIRIRHVGTSGTVSVNAAGADLITGPVGAGTSYQIPSPRDDVTLVSAGSGWIALALYNRPGSITTEMLSSAISGSFTKVGTIVPWATSTPPAGYLHCNGTAISRVTYAELFAVIGTIYGVGDGTTTFNLPDYRGEFLRGWANGSANDPDRAARTNSGGGVTGDNVGTKQADAFKTHLHSATGITATTVSAGAHTHTVTVGLRNATPDVNSASADWSVSNVSATTSSAGAHTHTVTVAGNTASTGGSETRARNVSVMWVIFADPASATGSSSPLHTILHGSGSPIDSIGIDDDFYIDIDEWSIYGPKGAGTWAGTGFPLGISPRGDWLTATVYHARNLVRSGAATYLSTAEHTSDAATEPGVGASWQTAWMLFSSVNGGDVIGPAGAADNAVARFDLATGKLLQSSSVTVADDGTVNIPTGASYDINGTAVVNGVQTGWGTPTGTLSRATFVTTTVTLPNLAAAVAQLIIDLKAGNFPRT